MGEVHLGLTPQCPMACAQKAVDGDIAEKAGGSTIEPQKMTLLMAECTWYNRPQCPLASAQEAIEGDIAEKAEKNDCCNMW